MLETWQDLRLDQMRDLSGLDPCLRHDMKKALSVISGDPGEEKPILKKVYLQPRTTGSEQRAELMKKKKLLEKSHLRVEVCKKELELCRKEVEMIDDIDKLPPPE